MAVIPLGLDRKMIPNLGNLTKHFDTGAEFYIAT